MPYRSLPDSDPSRIAALDALAAKAAGTAIDLRPYPADLQAELDILHPHFKAEAAQAGTALSAQTTASTQATLDFLALHMLISHFIQVFNLAVARGVFPREARAYYQLDTASSSLPTLSSRADVIRWADRLATGETARLNAGATLAMSNPGISDIQTARAAYILSSASQSHAKDAYDHEQEDVAALRPSIDALILDIWDHIEFTYRKDDGPSLRRKCREWGILYIPRPDETPDPDSAPAAPEATPPEGA